MFTYLDNLQHICQPRCIHLWLFSQETGPLTDLDLQGASQNPHAAVEKTHVGRTQGVTLAQTTYIQGVVFVHVCSDGQKNEQRFVRGVFTHPPKGVVNGGFINLCFSFNVTGDM